MDAIPAPTPVFDSITVLPFLNLSGERENEYFSDGLTEEIIDALTNVRGLRVISRTSTFAYKTRQQDVREIAENLHVSAVLEGSVRKEGGRVRVMAQLIDAASGVHIGPTATTGV